MLFELREYDIVPGKLPAVNERFKEVALRYFAKHGIEPLGFWTDIVGTSNRLTYLVRYEDMAHRDRAWTAFMNDQDRLAEFADTETEGPLVVVIRNRFLAPTDYSALT